MGSFKKDKKGKTEEWSWEESQATKDALAKYWSKWKNPDAIEEYWKHATSADIADEG